MPRKNKQENQYAVEEIRKTRRAAQKEEGIIENDTRRSLIAIGILGFSLLLFFSLIGLLGKFGIWLSDLFYLIWGWSTWFLPLMLIILGIWWYRSDHKYLSRVSIGMFLGILSIAGLFNIAIEGPELKKALSEGQGGGWIGYAIGHPLYTTMDMWGAILILIILLIAGIIIALNASLEDLVDLVVSKENNVNKFEDDKKEIEAKDIKKEIAPPIPENFSFEDNSNDLIENTSQESTPKISSISMSNTRIMAAQSGIKSSAENALTTDGTEKAENFSLDLLDDETEQGIGGDVEINKLRIKRTLENFSIPCEMTEVFIGPTVTQYTLKPGEGVQVKKITSLANNLAMALSAHPIRIEAPIPGKPLVGIEVPNKGTATVRLKSLLQSDQYLQKKFRLPLPLGRDVAGQPVVVGLEQMPHLLIAGATGAGKSVAINTFLLSLIYANSSDTLKLILVDPKRVELSMYSDIPHLLAPVITEADKTVNALKWAVGEMDNRYKLLASVGKKHIESYNASVALGKLPYIVIVIDELAELMVVSGKEVEALIVRLAQLARAVGIHLLLATQRPSVDVITGLIKANIPGRIAFTVNSVVDSRTILDQAGAEKLLGKGDLLFTSATLSKPRRIQGAYVSESEIERIADILRSHGEPSYQEAVTIKVSGGKNNGDDDDGGDPLYNEAKNIVIETQKASASLLQRHLRVGYARAARLLDLLEKNGVVGPGEGAKPREILYRANLDTSQNAEPQS